jgi:CRP-like cAMP-binding protein
MNPEAAEAGGFRIFTGMAPGDVEVVLAACQRRVAAAGEVIAAEGEAGDSLVLVRSGRVEIFKAIRADVDRVLGTLLPGDVTGVMGFLDGSRLPAGARATEPSELSVLTRAAFERLRLERPEVAAPLYRNLAAVLAGNLRAALELYREAVLFGIEATGASGLSLTHLVEDLRATTVHLVGGESISGRILQMDHHAAGHTLVVKDAAGRLSVVPYHAILRIEVG